MKSAQDLVSLALATEVKKPFKPTAAQKKKMASEAPSATQIDILKKGGLSDAKIAKLNQLTASEEVEKVLEKWRKRDAGPIQKTLLGAMKKWGIADEAIAACENHGQAQKMLNGFIAVKTKKRKAQEA